MHPPLAQRLARAFLSLGYVGFVPLAPGTWGTAAALLALSALHAALPPDTLVVLAADAFLFAVGWGLALLAMRSLPPSDDPDRPYIVVDELLGAIVAYAPAAFLNGHPLAELTAAFVLFRIFDVWKPLGIRAIDRRRTPASVLLDDVAAGALAAICLVVVFARLP